MHKTSRKREANAWGFRSLRPCGTATVSFLCSRSDHTKRRARQLIRSLCSQRAQVRKVEGHPYWSCAPGTRALGRASFDGRSWTSIGVLPGQRQTSKLGRSITFLCSRNAQTRGGRHGNCRASVLAEPAQSECARSMRAVETLPVACQRKRNDWKNHKGGPGAPIVFLCKGLYATDRDSSS